MSPNTDDFSILMSFLPYLLMSIPLAVGNYYLAGRLGKNRILWAIQSVIPGYNFVFWTYVWFVVVFRVLDQLAKIANRVGV